VDLKVQSVIFDQGIPPIEVMENSPVTFLGELRNGKLETARLLRRNVGFNSPESLCPNGRKR